MSEQRIFVLGDSRTGTTSLHHYFWANGLPSEHGFASAVAPHGEVTVQSVFDSIDTIIERPRYYWPIVKEYIYRSPAVAFSDYPIRIFWREILDEFPDARYILSMRRSVEIWRSSLNRTFGSVLQKQQLDLMEMRYVVLNELIRAYCNDARISYSEIVAEDSARYKTEKLEILLDKNGTIPIGHHNTLS